MNWPALSAETSANVAEVLRAAAHSKPKDLFAFVAKALQDKSGLNPAEFERYFEECQRRPRTFMLEDRCPAGQDPLAWVPMRYSDDTIRAALKSRSAVLTSEILSALPIADMKAMLDGICIAFPEFTYIRSAPSEPITDFGGCAPAELAAFQALRALYLGCSGSPTVSADDESIQMSFMCEALVQEARQAMLQPLLCDTALEACIVLIMLRALGSDEGFQRRYGGGKTIAEEAALHAIENEAMALPSFLRLGATQQASIRAALAAFVPAEAMVSAEAAPAQYQLAKEALLPTEGAMELCSCAMMLDHMVRCRCRPLRDEEVDAVKLAMRCMASVDKYSAPRAFELYLKKRAEKHAWRLARDDVRVKAVARLCCLAGLQDTESWNGMLSMAEDLPDRATEILETELARKDGCLVCPAYTLLGASRLLEAAVANPALGARPAALLLAKILEEAGRYFGHAPGAIPRAVTIDMQTCAQRARDYASGGPRFDDLPCNLKQTGPNRAALVLPGDP
mmetsp:Transcript_16269/g.48408  ORF Transcript_16269/g.48408 Transcript_16269/m.48408 type:complete len:510 (-) Transcript_16269:42-1571(-)